jgi:16S rRNA (cytosine967-C5)-methyltransferase
VEAGAFASRLLARPTTAGVRTRVLGVLRLQRSLDAVLEPRCRRPVDRLDAEVRVALRIGLYEAVGLGVPAAVATDGAVHLVRRLGVGSASGLVNAVLRQSIDAWSEEMNEAPPDIRLSHPEWLYRRWSDNFGADQAERSMAAAQEPAPLWVWFFDDEREDLLADRGLPLGVHPWCPGVWRAPNRDSDLLTEVAGGFAYAQDPSSQLVAHLGHRLMSRGLCVDSCAAPGGKSALLAKLGGYHRALALDLRPGRARMMRPLLDRYQTSAIAVADGGQPPLRPGTVDLLVLDAPCTGTGTLRRHPELRWRLRPESIHELSLVQRRLIAAAMELVAPGGVMVYATCSVEPEENEDLFAVVPDRLAMIDLEPVLPRGVPWIPTAAGGIRILPNVNGDGFTIHAVRRAEK